MHEIRWKVIVIGCRWGANLARAAGAIEGVEVVAAVDLDKDRARKVAGELETEPYIHSGRAIDERDPDVALIAVDNEHHREVALECIRSGLHVYLEKPCGRGDTPDEVLEIDRAARERGLAFMPGYSQRFAPYARKALEVVRDGELGRIYAVDILRQANFMPAAPSGPGWGIHDYDLCCLVADSGPERVSAFFPGRDARDICNAEVIVEHKNGVLSRCKTSTTAFSLEVAVRVYGTRGELEARRSDQTVRLSKDAEQWALTIEREKTFWERAVELFFAHLDGEEELPVRPREVLRGRKVLAAALKAAGGGE